MVCLPPSCLALFQACHLFPIVGVARAFPWFFAGLLAVFFVFFFLFFFVFGLLFCFRVPLASFLTWISFPPIAAKFWDRLELPCEPFFFDLSPHVPVFFRMPFLPYRSFFCHFLSLSSVTSLVGPGSFYSVCDLVALLRACFWSFVYLLELVVTAFVLRPHARNVCLTGLSDFFFGLEISVDSVPFP